MLLKVLDFLYVVAEKAVSVFNFLEALFWIAVALGVFAVVLRALSPRTRTLLLAAVLFFFFGVSDFFEVASGAWWRPWWLLVWKGLCVISLVSLYAVYRFGYREPAVADAPYWTG